MKGIKKIWLIFYFIFFYLARVVKSNIQIAWDILTPKFYMAPAIVEVPLNLTKDHEILAFANLITMTPGTLTMEISEDKKKIYIHVMYYKDKEKFFKGIRELEDKIHKIFK